MCYEAERLAEQIQSKLAYEYPDVDFGVWATPSSDLGLSDDDRALLGKDEVVRVVWSWLLMGLRALEVEYLLHRYAHSVPIVLEDRPTATRLWVSSKLDRFVKQTGRSWVCFS